MECAGASQFKEFSLIHPSTRVVHVETWTQVCYSFPCTLSFMSWTPALSPNYAHIIAAKLARRPCAFRHIQDMRDRGSCRPGRRGREIDRRENRATRPFSPPQGSKRRIGKGEKLGQCACRPRSRPLGRQQRAPSGGRCRHTAQDTRGDAVRPPPEIARQNKAPTAPPRSRTAERESERETVLGEWAPTATWLLSQPKSMGRPHAPGARTVSCAGERRGSLLQQRE